MKLIIAICFTLISLTSIAQVIQYDSAWHANYFIPKFTKDTGINLPDTKFIDEKGKERTLAEFKGKILYIGVWATDCASSVENLVHTGPLMKRLKAAQIDTQFKFINICFGESKKEWKKIIKEVQPPGINLYCRDKDFEKNWNISGVIKYVLVAPSGKVLSFNFLQPTEALDYFLYATAKGIKPIDAMWVDLRQQKHFSLYRKFTNDAEGQDYARWYASTIKELVEYFKWREARRKSPK